MKQDIEFQYVKFLRILKDQKGWEEWSEKEMPNHLKMIEKRLIMNKGSHYLVGNSVTLADFVVFEFLYELFMRPSVRDEHLMKLKFAAPRLMDYADNFLEMSKELKEYLKNRPERPI